MIIGIGLDFVDLTRFERILDRHGGRLLTRLFTEAERTTAAASGHPAESLAARLAAKEAALKALGTGRIGVIRWRDVEVRGSAPPTLALHGEALARARRLGVGRCHLSLSHEVGHAAAVVILEDGPGGLLPASSEPQI